MNRGSFGAGRPPPQQQRRHALVAAGPDGASAEGAGAEGAGRPGVIDGELLPDEPLSERERLFVAEYLNDLNATGAAARAGYRWPNSLAGKLKARPRVRAAIEAAMEERRRRLGVSAEDVVMELALVGFASLADVADWGVDADGGAYLAVTPRQEMPAALARTLCELQCVGGAMRVRQHDKVAALKLLARHLGVLKTASMEKLDERLARELEIAKQHGIVNFLCQVPLEVRQEIEAVLAAAGFVRPGRG